MSDSMTLKPIMAVKCIIQMAVPPKANAASAIHWTRLRADFTGRPGGGPASCT